MQITSDIEFLVRISSVHQALLGSAVDPVIVPYGAIREPAKKEIHTHLYWDCEENEEGALEIIKYRIDTYKADLRNHRNAHMLMKDCLMSIREGIENNDAKQVREYSENLAVRLEDYGNLVLDHQKREAPFLRLPSCPLGHYIQLKAGIFMKEFNREDSYEHFSEDLTGLRQYSSKFNSKGIDPTDSKNLFPETETFQNPNTLTGRIRTNDLLLKRASDQISKRAQTS